MINVIITAGGTSESIDGVRVLTNTATGKLASLIAKELLEKDVTVHYIHSKSAILPVLNPNENDKLALYEITDVTSLKAIVESLLQNHKIDIFIHSMAVSDFTMDHAISVEELAEKLADLSFSGSAKDKKEEILKVLRESKDGIQSKLSSDQDVCMVMKRTPKIINIVKKMSPDTFLIGFKLLNSGSEDDLLSAAKKQIKINNCDYVLGNQLKNITADRHEAILIDKSGVIEENFHTKPDIAKGILRVLEKRRLLY
ncbi:MAG: hypothetical protein HGA49_10975 [Eubacteriaceae bacterium]|nr:hypothetical protein [Eubacteriaceae bacterium]